MTGLIVGIILTVATLLGVGAAVTAALITQERQRAEWNLIPGFGPVRFHGPVEPDVLSAALERATELAKPSFSGKAFDQAMQRLQVLVVAGETWTSAAGTHIGGEADAFLIKTGPSLGSLFHELVHVLEFSENGIADDQHQLWQARGFWLLDEKYRAVPAVLRGTP